MQASFIPGAPLQLRALEAGDADALAAYLNHPDLAGCRYLPWAAPETTPLSRQHIEQALKTWTEDKTAQHFAIRLAEGGEVIGHAEIDWGWDPHCPEVAVVIAPPRRRCGYGSATLQLLLRHLFQTMPAYSVGAWFADWNLAAQAFARRHGFSDAGRVRWAGLRGGQPFDVLNVDLLRPEWQAQVREAGHGA